MSHIIGSKCIDVCDSACVSVCPVDCIHGPVFSDKNGTELAYLKDTGDIRAIVRPQMYIDPQTCINCGACLTECPVGAIYEDEIDAIAEGDEESVHRNYNFFGLKYK
jgi:NAD-dependent dihydropyrimidine dehydrogenase PreA subunit